MSAISSGQPVGGFSSKHEVNAYTAATMLSLAMGIFSLGVIIAAMGTSSHWYWHFTPPANGVHDLKWHLDDPHIPSENSSIPEQVTNADEIQNALQYGAQVGAVALGPCIAGFILFLIFSFARRRAMQNLKQEVENAPSGNIGCDATSNQWKNIGILIGFSIASFSAGLMIGSSLILHNGVSKVEDLISHGRNDLPDARLYQLDIYLKHVGEKHHHWVHWDNTGDNFWDRLQSDWVDSTKSAMSGMIPVGLFGALGGSGLVGFSLFGRGVFSFLSCIKERFAKKEDERGEL